MSDYKLVPVEPTPKMLQVWKSMHGYSRYNKYQAMLDAAPTLQAEPVAWSGWGCQYPGKMPRLYGERRIAELNCDWENGDQLLHFTAAPQPAEQQPDVTQLMEALELALEYWRHRMKRYRNARPVWVAAAEKALAAYHKGGES